MSEQESMAGADQRDGVRLRYRAAAWFAFLILMRFVLCFGCTRTISKKRQVQEAAHTERAKTAATNITLNMVSPQDLEEEGAVVVRDGYPLLLHQSYRSRDTIKPFIKMFMKSWETNYAEVNGWKHVFWTDQDNEDLIRRTLPWMLDTYLGYPHNIQRADIARMAVLRAYGGVYADMDYECLRPECMNFENRMSDSGCSVHLVEASSPSWDGLFMNSLMAAKKNKAAEEFWDRTLHVAQKQAADLSTRTWMGSIGFNQVLMTTGPALLTLSYGEYTGVDAASMKGKPNFNGDKLLKMFEAAGKMPKAKGADVCKLPYHEYNGQMDDSDPAHELAHHHNSGTWVNDVRGAETHLPRILPVMVASAAPFLMMPFLWHAVTAVIFTATCNFPGSNLEGVIVVVFVAVLALAIRNSRKLQMKLEQHDERMPLYLVVVAIAIRIYLKADQGV